MKSLKTYLYEGLLDIDDTINTDHTELYYNNLVNSEEFKKEFISPWARKFNGSIEYKNGVLYVRDFIMYFKKHENINIMEYLPGLKRIECNEICDDRLVIDNTNTPKEIVTGRYSVTNNVKKMDGVHFISSGKINKISLHLDEQSEIKDVNFFCNTLSLGIDDSGILPKLNNVGGDFKCIEIGYDFGSKIPELDKLINQTRKISLYNAKKDKSINKTIKSFKDIKSIMNGKYKTNVPLIEFNSNAEILKTLGLQNVKSIEYVKIGNTFYDIWFVKNKYIGGFYDIYKEYNGGCETEDLPTTKDGFKCFFSIYNKF